MTIDPEKSPDCPFTRVFFRHVRIESRYQKRHEYAEMQRALSGLGDEIHVVVSVFCDSNACASYTITVHDMAPISLVMGVGGAFERGLVGHNGITVETQGGLRVKDIDPFWPGDGDVPF